MLSSFKVRVPYPLGFPQGDAGSVLQVANVNAKDGTCTLKDCVYKDVQKDWPGYSEGDQQLLKRMLVRYDLVPWAWDRSHPENAGVALPSPKGLRARSRVEGSLGTL